MYYVIQHYHNDPKKHYLAFHVPRYIASEKSKNVIFEFQHEGAVKRKWAPKEEIVLITEDLELFESTLRKLETIKKHHLERINTAETQLKDEIDAMLGAMQQEFDSIKGNL